MSPVRGLGNSEGRGDVDADVARAADAEDEALSRLGDAARSVLGGGQSADDADLDDPDLGDADADVAAVAPPVADDEAAGAQLAGFGFGGRGTDGIAESIGGMRETLSNLTDNLTGLLKGESQGTHDIAAGIADGGSDSDVLGLQDDGADASVGFLGGSDLADDDDDDGGIYGAAGRIADSMRADDDDPLALDDPTGDSLSPGTDLLGVRMMDHEGFDGDADDSGLADNFDDDAEDITDDGLRFASLDFNDD
jgi:hypothetical protein